MANRTTTEPVWLELSPDFPDRLAARLVAHPSGCLVWTGAKNSSVAGKGYGMIRAAEGKRMVYTHRAAWQLANGAPIPAGAVVCHTCDNGLCCHPEHLFAASQGANVQDMVEKGRAVHGSRYMSDEDVAKLRQMVESGVKIADAARALGVNYWTARDIANKRNRRFCA